MMKKDYVIYSLNKAKKTMHQYVDILLKEEGFNDLVSAYSDILTVLFLHGGKLKMHEISELVGKDKSTITVLINRLVEKDYVIKEKSPEDKRVYYVSLSDKSNSSKAAFNGIADQIRHIAFEGFSKEEQKDFMTYLKRLEDNFINKMKEERGN